MEEEKEMSGAAGNRRNRITAAAGAAVMILALICVAFCCTNTRIDPAVRMAYDTGIQPQEEDEDFAQLLELLGDDVRRTKQ